jgi:hypothetical protein
VLGPCTREVRVSLGLGKVYHNARGVYKAIVEELLGLDSLELRLVADETEKARFVSLPHNFNISYYSF